VQGYYGMDYRIVMHTDFVVKLLNWRIVELELEMIQSGW